MSFVSRNHPQQTVRYGPRDDIDDRATTPEMFAGLQARFGFTVDVAASAANAKLARFYTRADDGLAQDWSGERVWCNPPYSTIPPWVEKAWSSWPAAALIVMLLPANRTEQGWWQDLVEPARRAGTITVEFLRGRIRFLRPGQQGVGAGERPPMGVCLVIWGPVPAELNQADTARLWASSAGDLFTAS